LSTVTRYLAAKTQEGASAAHTQALTQLANAVRREAFVMAYSDCFFVIGSALAISILAVFLVCKPVGARRELGAPVPQGAAK